MDINAFMQELGGKFDTVLKLDSSHSCTMLVNDVLLNIQYQPYDSSFLIHSLVAYREQGFNIRQLERALEINLFGYESLNFHLGYYKAMRSLILSTSIYENNLDVDNFAATLSLIVKKSEEFEKIIDALDDAEQNEDKNLQDQSAAPENTAFMLNV